MTIILQIKKMYDIYRRGIILIDEVYILSLSNFFIQ